MSLIICSIMLFCGCIDVEQKEVGAQQSGICVPSDQCGYVPPNNSSVRQMDFSIFERFPNIFGKQFSTNVCVQSYWLEEGSDWCDNHAIPSVSDKAATLILDGDFRQFPKTRYENIRALSWTINYYPEPCRQKDRNDILLSMNERVRRRLALLSIFPNLKYLTLEFRGFGKCDWSANFPAVCEVDLSALPVFKELECLEIVGGDIMLVGFNAYVPKLTKLRSLTVNEFGTHWRPDEGTETDGVNMVNSVAYLGKLPLEDVSLQRVILLHQGSLKCLQRVKKLVPPLYYSLVDVSESVECLDMACSYSPLDGFGGLARLPALKEIRIFKSDESKVKPLLKGRDVRIEIVDDEVSELVLRKGYGLVGDYLGGARKQRSN